MSGTHVCAVYSHHRAAARGTQDFFIYLGDQPATHWGRGADDPAGHTVWAEVCAMHRLPPPPRFCAWQQARLSCGGRHSRSPQPE